jgi:hypothetical protein
VIPLRVPADEHCEKGVDLGLHFKASNTILFYVNAPHPWICGFRSRKTRSVAKYSTQFKIKNKEKKEKLSAL